MSTFKQKHQTMKPLYQTALIIANLTKKRYKDIRGQQT